MIPKTRKNYKGLLRPLLMGLAALVPIAVSAAPVGNPSAPALIQKGIFASSDTWIDARTGYEGDFVADGRMDQLGGARVDSYEQDTNSGTFTLNFLGRLDLYGVFGSSKAEANWRFENSAAQTITRIETQTKSHFLWAVGSRALLYEWGNVSLGVGGRYSFCNYTPSWLTANGIDQSVTGADFLWKEWQVNLDLSYKIDFLIPYVGVKYSYAEAKLKGFPTPISAGLAGENSFKTRVPVGVYVGCTLSNGSYFMLNLEGRLVDEEAVTVSGDFRF